MNIHKLSFCSKRKMLLYLQHLSQSILPLLPTTSSLPLVKLPLTISPINSRAINNQPSDIVGWFSAVLSDHGAMTFPIINIQIYRGLSEADLADWGPTQEVGPTHRDYTDMTWPSVRAPRWSGNMAPEKLNYTDYTVKSDSWYDTNYSNSPTTPTHQLRQLTNYTNPLNYSNSPTTPTH